MPSEIVFFSTLQGKAVILCNDIAAIMLDSILRQQYGAGFREMGVGNGFLVNEQERIELFTANHCAIGLEEVAVKAEGDIAIVPMKFFKSMNNINTGSAYRLAGNDFMNNDSVYVHGYLFGKDRQIHDVTISGRGTVIDAEKIKGDKNFRIQSTEPFEGRSVWLAMKHGVDLSGLSGAPAFNQHGHVVGVYSGRSAALVNSDTVWYARIALLN